MFGIEDTNNNNGATSQSSINNQDFPEPKVITPIHTTHPISGIDSDDISHPIQPLSSVSPTQAPPTAQPEDKTTEGLLKLKQDALQSLAPMVNKLDQTPEEKFKTIMMLIQASDNTDLVAEAYETAKQITDEKERAQALIDVVNEINYFTHPKTS